MCAAGLFVRVLRDHDESAAIDRRVDFTFVRISSRADGCSSQVPRGRDESDAASPSLFSAGLAERLGAGLPPRPRGFDSHGPHFASLAQQEAAAVS